MDGSRLASLPAELLNTIYELVLVYPAPILVELDPDTSGLKPQLRITIDEHEDQDGQADVDDQSDEGNADDQDDEANENNAIPGTTLPQYPLALIQTCKRIHFDCAHLLYALNHFKCLLPSCPAQEQLADLDLQARDAVCTQLARQQLAPFHCFMDAVGSKQATAIADLTVDFGAVIAEEDLMTYMPHIVCKTLGMLKREAKERRLGGLKVVLRMYCVRLPAEGEGDEREDDDDGADEGDEQDDEEGGESPSTAVVEGVVDIGAPQKGLAQLMAEIESVEGGIVGEEFEKLDQLEKLEAGGLLAFVRMCGEALGVVEITD